MKSKKNTSFYWIPETEMTGMVLSVPWQVPSAGPRSTNRKEGRQGEKSMPFLQQGLEDGFTPTLPDGLICSNCEYYIIQLQRLKEQLFIILGLSLTGRRLAKKFIRVNSLRRTPERPFGQLQEMAKSYQVPFYSVLREGDVAALIHTFPRTWF